MIVNKKLKRDITSLLVAGTPIPYVDNAMHLGSYIGPNSHKLNLKKAVQDMNTQVNMLVANYAHCHFDTLCHSFRSSEDMFVLWFSTVGTVIFRCIYN